MLWFLAGYSGIRAASGAAPSTKASIAIHMEIRVFYTPPRHRAMSAARRKDAAEKHSPPLFEVGKDHMALKISQEFY